MPEQPKRPVPRGKALDSTDEDLDAAAEITAEDLESAQAAVRRHGRGTELPAMLDAEDGEDG